jgi:hypothetical protein
MEMHKRRSRLRMYRDMAIGVMWLIIAVTFVGVYLTYAPMIDDLDVTPTSTPRTMIAVTATISSPDR